MISFMVLGGPRSGTTWLANLLTTDSTLCLHDPLLEHQAHVLDQMQIPNKRVGIADTSALLYPKWLAQHRAKKIVIWRDPAQINLSLRALGMIEVDPHGHAKRIGALPKGIKTYPYESLFNHYVAKEICDFFDVPFCRWRFQELKKMNVQPQFSRLPIGKEAMQDFHKRFMDALGEDAFRDLVQRAAKELGL